MRTLQTFTLFAISLISLFLERLLLLFTNWDYFSQLSTSSILEALLFGIKFDISTLLTFTAIPMLLFLYLNSFRKLFSYIWFGIFLTILTTNIVDVFYFPYAHRHLSNELFIMGNDLDFAIDVVGGYLLEIGIYAVSIAILFLIWKRVTNWKIEDSNISISRKIAHFLMVALLIFLGIREKIEGKPLAISDAFLEGDIRIANLVLNGTYSIYRGRPKKLRKYMDSEKALQITKSYLESNITRWVENGNPLERYFIPKERRKYNIVLIVVESLSSKYVDSFGDGNYSVTPYLDKLAKEGIAFPNFYANGQRSIEGITSILTGIPVIAGIPYLGYGLETTPFSYLGTLLKENGYTTLGGQASKYGSFRIGNILQIAGFQKTFGAEQMREYRKDEVDADLVFESVWDGNLFRYLLEKIDKLQKPFFTFAFTASTHFPCKLPNRKYEKYPHDEWKIEGYLNLLYYFDSQLKEFIESAKEREWFKDTIFIITGDHTIGKGIGITKQSFAHFRIPLIIYAPYIFKPQTIQQVGSQVDILPTILDMLGISSQFATFSNSLFDTSSNTPLILKEGDRMVMRDREGWKYEGDRDLQAILQTLTELIVQGRIYSK